MDRPMFGEEKEPMGGQTWPCFTATVQEDDQMSFPTRLRKIR